MYYVILTELGISVFDEDKCVKSIKFSEPAQEYTSIKQGNGKFDELKDYLRDKEDSSILVNDHSLSDQLRKKSLEVQMMDEKRIEVIQDSKLKVLVDSGFVNDEKEARDQLRKFAMQLSSVKVTESSESPDLHIIQSIGMLDELDKTINLLSSRLREWYGLHFPELENLIDSIQAYAKLVTVGRREDLTKEDYTEAGIAENRIEMLTEVQERSRGGKISDENLYIIQDIANKILESTELRKKLESHVDNQMRQVAPNLSEILGTSVGARILSRAGSLKKLAAMPSSTIQVLGAEKALFRSLKTGSEPPKHGLLFQHTLVHSAPRWQRGKIARAVAAKAAIAARIDAHGGSLDQNLYQKLNVRVDEIGEKYKEAPAKKEKTTPRHRTDTPFRKRGGGKKAQDLNKQPSSKKEKKQLKKKKKWKGKFGKRKR